MKCEHTPTPWDWQKFGNEWFLVGQHGMRPIVLSYSKRTGLTSLVDGLLKPFDPEHPDAQFIVRACNSHAELVRVLKEAMTHNGVEHDTTLKEMIVSALKTAGEEV